MAYQHILFDVADHVATLTINRPAVLNALAQQTVAELTEAIDRLQDEEARVLLITGTGRAFSSGADLSAGFGDRSRRDIGLSLERGYNPLLERIAELPIPVVTAVNGVAAGAGCGLALTGDLVIAGESAYFLQAFVNIGLVPDAGATWLLPRLIGKARATQMMMLGERIPAATALDWGLIYQVVADDALAETAQALARRLAAGPTAAYALMRQGIARAATQSLTEALAMERVSQRAAGRTDDHAEGVAAFLEKRKPDFTGR